MSRGFFRRAPMFRLSAIAIACLLLAGCGSDSVGRGKSAAPPVSATTMAVSGARATVVPLRSEVRLLGNTAALRHISLRAPAAGLVTGMNLQIGDRVARGEVVGYIVSREVEAAKNGLAIARQIDRSEAAALAAAVKRYGRGPGVAIRAPDKAIVARRIVSSGQMVADLDPLADLIDPRSIYVDAAVPVDDMAMIRSGMDAIVTSPLHPGIEYAARVAALAPAFNQNGATSPARIEFTGPNRISEAGAPVDVLVTTKFVPDAITVPSAALFEDPANDSYYVFVVGPDSQAHRTPVTLGIRTQTLAQIVSGLRPGQIVVTSGGYALSNGLKVTVALAQR